MSHALTFHTLPYRDNFQLAELVRSGMPARTVREIAEALAVSPLQFAEIVQIAPRTLMRRLSENARLKSDETERVLRIGRLLKRAAEVLDGEDEAAKWFRHPLHALGEKTPLEMCSTEPGAREVEDVLGRIEHGVFA
jgi:putative toxin-antitoxin system antitoxin component (TIGR02293 family)